MKLLDMKLLLPRETRGVARAPHHDVTLRSRIVRSEDGRALNKL
jgi:hypothetical protein